MENQNSLPPILNSEQAAELLHVSEVTLLRQARAGAIPFRRLGRRYLFSTNDILNWISQIPPQPTPQADPVNLDEAENNGATLAVESVPRVRRVRSAAFGSVAARGARSLQNIPSKGTYFDERR